MNRRGFLGRLTGAAAGVMMGVAGALPKNVLKVADTHFEYDKLIEDVASVQPFSWTLRSKEVLQAYKSNLAFRQMYVDEAGDALAREIDRHILELS